MLPSDLDADLKLNNRSKSIYMLKCNKKNEFIFLLIILIIYSKYVSEANGILFNY